MKSVTDDSRIFTADYIIKHRRRKGRIYYLIKWLGWSFKYCTWEPPENIFDKSLIETYESECGLKEDHRRRRQSLPVRRIRDSRCRDKRGNSRRLSENRVGLNGSSATITADQPTQQSQNGGVNKSGNVGHANLAPPAYTCVADRTRSNATVVCISSSSSVNDDALDHNFVDTLSKQDSESNDDLKFTDEPNFCDILCNKCPRRESGCLSDDVTRDATDDERVVYDEPPKIERIENLLDRVNSLEDIKLPFITNIPDVKVNGPHDASYSDDVTVEDISNTDTFALNDVVTIKTECSVPTGSIGDANDCDEEFYNDITPSPDVSYPLKRPDICVYDKNVQFPVCDVTEHLGIEGAHSTSVMYVRPWEDTTLSSRDEKSHNLLINADVLDRPSHTNNIAENTHGPLRADVWRLGCDNSSVDIELSPDKHRFLDTDGQRDTIMATNQSREDDGRGLYTSTVSDTIGPSVSDSHKVPPIRIARVLPRTEHKSYKRKRKHEKHERHRYVKLSTKSHTYCDYVTQPLHITVTDVTCNEVTVTFLESPTEAGFFSPKSEPMDT